MKLEINLKMQGDAVIEQKILATFKEKEGVQEDFIINLARLLMGTFKIKLEDNLTVESCKFLFEPEEAQEPPKEP